MNYSQSFIIILTLLFDNDDLGVGVRKMIRGFPIAWTSFDPVVQGLKLGGLMNESIERDDTYRQGRHHFITAVNQILEGNLALEQMTRYLRATGVNHSLMGLHVLSVLVPVVVAQLASRQIHFCNISVGANFIQTHWNKITLVTLIAGSVGLFTVGQTAVATTTLVYLSIGILNRNNLLFPSVQKVIHQANFFIGNSTGIYLGGNLVRVVSTLNIITKMVTHAVKAYFDECKKNEIESLIDPEVSEVDDDIEMDDMKETHLTLSELKELDNDERCLMRKSHIKKLPLPYVDESVQLQDILKFYDLIDWSKHAHVLVHKLSKDKRWLEVGQFEFSDPLKYFKTNLWNMITSIQNHSILEGKPGSYEMLEFYCRFIAQELKAKDEMTQADTLMLLGVEGGDYCGTGKFGIVEEIYESFLSQAEGLPLKTRILACEQQERQRIWQNIYQMIWRINPFMQLFGYVSDVNAIHNANIFTNLVRAGEKFGIPHQTAKNDQSAAINPLVHYLAFLCVDMIEECFWKGNFVPQIYMTIEKMEGKDWWKAWKWVHLKYENIYSSPYNEDAILERLSQTIGTPQIPKSDIYLWWAQWTERQNKLTEDERDDLMMELTTPTKDKYGKDALLFNGESFEVDGKIQPKFLKAMLIEMEILDKPEDFQEVV